MDEVVVKYLWEQGMLEWKLWEQQIPIYDGIRDLPEGVETVVVLCARQFGKSYLGVIMAIEDALRYPNRCILIVGPTYKQTIEIVAPRIRDIAKDAPPGLIQRSKSEGKWLVGESEIVIGGFDQNSSSQRGKTVQSIYIEEVVDSNPDKYIDSMRSDLGPALTHSDGGKMIFLTTLPKIPSHPFVVDTIPTARLQGSFYSYTIDDNIALSQAQYEACVRRAGGRDSVDFRREYLNELIRDERTSICPPFERKKHVKPINRPGIGLYSAVIDWGGVRDKTVGLICVYDFERNKLLVCEELAFGPNTPTSEIVAALRVVEDKYEVDDRVADCPGQLSVDLLRMGYPIRPPIKADWVAGINALQVAFAQDQIEIDPSCVLLAETLESGQFNRSKTDFERTASLGHCDSAAALMYAWRCIRRENPFRQFYQAGQNTFVSRMIEDPMANLSNAIQPKTFGRFRK